MALTEDLAVDIRVVDPWTLTGIVVVGAAAAVTSWAGWDGLAQLAGYHHRVPIPGTDAGVPLSWLLPITVDVYALVTARVWLHAPGASARTRAWARWQALAAVALGVAGTSTFHVLSGRGVQPMNVPNADHAPAWLVVILAAIAPLMVGLVAHLAGLLADDRRAARGAAAAIGREPPESATEGHRDSAGSAEIRRAGDPTGSGSEQWSGSASDGPDRESVGDTDRPERLSESRDGRTPTEIARAHWDAERAAGRTPTGAELDRVAGTRDYGRALRRQWLAADGEEGRLHAV